VLFATESEHQHRVGAVEFRDESLVGAFAEPLKLPAVCFECALALGCSDIDEMSLDCLFDHEPLVRTRRLLGCVDLAGLDSAPQQPGVKRLTGCRPDRLGPAPAVFSPVQVKGAALRADRWFAVDDDHSRVGLALLFHDRDELPFSVNPAILSKVHLMSMAAFYCASIPSRPVPEQGPLFQSSPSSLSCDPGLNSAGLDSKLDGKKACRL